VKKMKTIIAPLAAIAVLGLGAGAASAASPAYCALYAKEFARHAAFDSQGALPPELIHDRAYHKCLNLDDEPVLPTAYTDPTTDGGRFVLDQGSADSGLDDTFAAEPAVDEQVAEEPKAEQTAALESDPQPARKRTGTWSGSGYAMWSPEWEAWCSEHFPKSFDPATGTIIPYKTGVRSECR
jgi:hypothetical protein